eukprot:3564640-Rhodomonas_salina.2
MVPGSTRRHVSAGSRVAGVCGQIGQLTRIKPTTRMTIAFDITMTSSEGKRFARGGGARGRYADFGGAGVEPHVIAVCVPYSADRRIDEEQNKELVVAHPDAVVDEYTVMIHPQHAAFALAAVVSSLWLIARTLQTDFSFEFLLLRLQFWREILVDVSRIGSDCIV